MKITELTGYRTRGYYPVAKHVFRNPVGDENPNRSEFYREFQLQKWTQFLESKGFVHLGSGQFGGTYEKAGYPWVFKIFKNDPAYLYYFKYIRAHQNNDNVPKIKGNVIKINDDTYAVRLEKLTPIANDLYNHLYACIRAMVQVEGVADIHKDTALFLGKFKKEYPGIYSVVRDMMKLPWRLDLGKANIMMRGNVPAIVDPIADI